MRHPLVEFREFHVGPRCPARSSVYWKTSRYDQHLISERAFALRKILEPMNARAVAIDHI